MIERVKIVINQLKKEAFKIYKIISFWQCNQDLGMIFEANAKPGLIKNPESGPAAKIDPLYP